MVKRTAYPLVAFVMLCFMAGNAFSEVILKKSQTVYVAAYPHVFMGPKGTVFDLSVTLLIRNTDLKLPVSVTAVDYYDTNGKLTKKYLSAPLTVNPMASSHILITEKDTSGGIGTTPLANTSFTSNLSVPSPSALLSA